MAARETHFGEGPAACPFVALDSDRDRRLDEPDHRHRCYAEPEPAPRAIAHQRAYCLSPNFPGCPIFQDWAVRAAARPAGGAGATGAGAAGAAAAGAAAAGAAGGTAFAAGDDERAAAPPPAYLDDDDLDAPPPRPAPAWAAPPPWVGREDAGPAEPEQIGAFDAPAFDEPVADDQPLASSSLTSEERPERQFPPAGAWPPAAAGGGLPPASSSPEEIERLPSLPVDPSGDPVRDAEIEAERRQRLEQDRERRAEDERLRRAEDERRERERRAAAAAAIPPFLAGRASAEGTAAGGPTASPPRAPQRSGPPDAAPPAALQTMATPQVKREDLVPVWEREPIHAYPTLRSRFSMGGGSSDVLGTLTGVLALLALLALVAFLVIAAPVLFGGGGPGRTQQPGAVATPTSAAGETVAPGATATPQPPPPTATPVAGPTPRTYTVRAGDTLFGIAEEFGLTVEQLLAANPEIVDANYVIVGQVLVIPDSGFVPPGSSAAPATPAP